MVGVVLCEHCGETKADLAVRKVDGKFPPCKEAEEIAAGNGY